MDGRKVILQPPLIVTASGSSLSNTLHPPSPTEPMMDSKSLPPPAGVRKSEGAGLSESSHRLIGFRSVLNRMQPEEITHLTSSPVRRVGFEPTRHSHTNLSRPSPLRHIEPISPTTRSYGFGRLGSRDTAESRDTAKSRDTAGSSARRFHSHLPRLVDAATSRGSPGPSADRLSNLPGGSHVAHPPIT